MHRIKKFDFLLFVQNFLFQGLIPMTKIYFFIDLSQITPWHIKICKKLIILNR